MRTSPQFLTILSAFLCFLTIDAIVVKQENSLFGPYQAGTGHLTYWDLTGSSQLAETTIRLTPDEPGKQGAIWNNYPMISNDWEFHMQFHIHGKGVHLNGNGLAFWFVKDPLHSGPIFGSKDYWTGLGVFIDTFENAATPHNHMHPYLSAVVNNGSFPYHHDEHGTAGQIGGCHLQARNLEWPAKVAISYISDVLTVFVDTHGTDNWAQCFRAIGVHLPTGYYFGVSASTGEYSDNHDVVAVTTLDNIIPDKVWEDKSHLIPHSEFVEIPFVQFEFEHEEEFQRDEHAVHEQPIIPEVKIEPPQEIFAEYEPEVKVEPQHHVKIEHQPQVKTEQQPQVRIEPEPQKKVEPEPKKKVEHEPKKKPPQPQVEEGPKVEPVPEAKVSMLRKVLYVAGIAIILYVAITMFRKYNAQRKERMQKRLY